MSDGPLRTQTRAQRNSANSFPVSSVWRNALVRMVAYITVMQSGLKTTIHYAKMKAIGVLKPPPSSLCQSQLQPIRPTLPSYLSFPLVGPTPADNPKRLRQKGILPASIISYTHHIPCALPDGWPGAGFDSFALVLIFPPQKSLSSHALTNHRPVPHPHTKPPQETLALFPVDSERTVLLARK